MKLKETSHPLINIPFNYYEWDKPQGFNVLCGLVVTGKFVTADRKDYKKQFCDSGDKSFIHPHGLSITIM